MYMRPPSSPQTPPQRADDVSTVLGVSVVNELPDIRFLPPPPPLYLPDTRFTRGSNRVHRNHDGSSVFSPFCAAATL